MKVFNELASYLSLCLVEDDVRIASMARSSRLDQYGFAVVLVKMGSTAWAVVRRVESTVFWLWHAL